MKKFSIIITLFFISHGFIYCFKSLPVDSFYIRIKQDQKLTEAIKLGNKNKVLKLIAERDVNKRLEGGSTMLLEAIYFRQAEIVKLLLDEGADPNLRAAQFKDVNDKWIPESSPLEAAIMSDTSFYMAGLLLKNGANINDTASGEGSVLHLAISGGNDKISSGFYREEDYTGLPAQNQETSLKKVTWLIKNGGEVNAKNSYGETPLFNAISLKYYDVARLLIDNKADVKIRDTSGRTLLYYMESPELAEKLIKKGIDINAQSSDGLTALHHAVFANNTAVAKLLVESGADVNLRDSDSRLTPLDWIIIEWGSYNNELPRLLILHKAVIDYNLAQQYGVGAEIEKIKKELGLN
jgi:ankyrin repeat protein